MTTPGGPRANWAGNITFSRPDPADLITRNTADFARFARRVRVLGLPGLG